MSVVQSAGIVLARMAMAALMVVVGVFSMVVLWKNMGFAWDQAGIILVLCAIAAELAKNVLPIVYYNARYADRTTATGALTAFVVLFGLSYACSMWWEISDGTNAASVIMLFIAHFFAAFGPLGLYRASKWVEDKPTDGLPRAPVALQPAPMQHDALPSPSGVEEIRQAFGDWVKARLSLIQTAQTELGAARANYTAWAGANMRANIHPQDFEVLMGEVADAASATVSNGIYKGLWFSDRDQLPLVAA